MLDKKGYEFSFAWIFSVFVGGLIIFFAIYAATRIIGVERERGDTFAGKEITVLLNPMQTNLEQSISNTITVSSPTRIYNECKKNSVFGTQSIGISTKSDVGDEWQPSGGRSSFRDRYLFSADEISAEKKFYLVSRPFEFPFKSADIIVMWGDEDKYCFVSPPDDIREEVENLNLGDKGIFIDECPEESKRVCFPTAGSKSNCDVIVQVSGGNKKVIQNEKEVFYVESTDDENKYPLLFAAIFSSPEIYECQVQRIMGRAAEIANLNVMKVDFLTGRGCGASLIKPELNAYSNRAQQIAEEGSHGFGNQNFVELAEGLGRKNEVLLSQCKIF